MPRTYKPRPKGYVPDLDHGFFTRTHYHAPPHTQPDIMLPGGKGVGFGEVRVLNASGECVRVISVDELLARPPLPWNPAEPDYDPKRTSKRSTKRKYGYSST